MLLGVSLCVEQQEGTFDSCALTKDTGEKRGRHLGTSRESRLAPLHRRYGVISFAHSLAQSLAATASLMMVSTTIALTILPSILGAIWPAQVRLTTPLTEERC